MAKLAVKTIVFVASPTGAYDLAYSAGDIADFEENQAKELVESGYANWYDPKDAAKPASDEVTE
jgi:hypothetical protein